MSHPKCDFLLLQSSILPTATTPANTAAAMPTPASTLPAAAIAILFDAVAVELPALAPSVLTAVVLAAGVAVTPLINGIVSVAADEGKETKLGDGSSGGAVTVTVAVAVGTTTVVPPMAEPVIVRVFVGDGIGCPPPPYGPRGVPAGSWKSSVGVAQQAVFASTPFSQQYSAGEEYPVEEHSNTAAPLLSGDPGWLPWQ